MSDVKSFLLIAHDALRNEMERMSEGALADIKGAGANPDCCTSSDANGYTVTECYDPYDFHDVGPGDSPCYTLGGQTESCGDVCTIFPDCCP